MNPWLERIRTPGAPTPVGTWIMAASPLVAEAIGCSGFEWGVVDMEHTPLDLMDLVHMLQAVSGTPLQPVVRVPWNDAVCLKRVMDAGATTLLVPFVENEQEALAAARAVRYPPVGTRGMAGMSRASRFGTRPGYFAKANDDVALIVQLETPTAVSNLESIARTPGVDALFLGPADLSGAMGHVGQLTHPEVLAVFRESVQRAHACNLPIGTVGGSSDTVREYLSMGFDFVAVGSDLSLMMRNASAELTAIRSASPTPTPTKSEGGY